MASRFAVRRSCRLTAANRDHIRPGRPGVQEIRPPLQTLGALFQVRLPAVSPTPRFSIALTAAATSPGLISAIGRAPTREIWTCLDYSGQGFGAGAASIVSPQRIGFTPRFRCNQEICPQFFPRLRLQADRRRRVPQVGTDPHRATEFRNVRTNFLRARLTW